MERENNATACAVALAGPYGAGKTTLLEALMFASGARQKMAEPGSNDRIGDRAPEARQRGHSTEMNVANFDYLGDRYAIIDLPGSNEFIGEAACALPAMDVAIVVADPEPARALMIQPWLIELDRLGVPAMVFVNKIEESKTRARDLLSALQEVSPRPLVMRQIPIWEGENVKGFVDLALERAYVYRSGDASKQVDIPSELADREADARFQMLEKLADFDDALMEALLEDATPDPQTVFADLAQELGDGLITPVFLGSAATGGGVRRLLKALRHEAPRNGAALKRVLGDKPDASASAYVMKTFSAGQAGKVSVARVLHGEIPDGATLTRTDGSSVRVGGLSAQIGQDLEKRDVARTGEVVALGRLGETATGEALTLDGPGVRAIVKPNLPPPIFARAVSVDDRKDEVKLTTALAKLAEEDAGLETGPDRDTGQYLVRGQGEMHLGVSLAKLERKFGVKVNAAPAATPYRETVKKSATMRGRHKKQSGGHGQFGDVVLEVKPLPRGQGFVFEERITGGVVPRNYFGAVEHGVRDAMQKGPLGFPVVDVAATLVDGSHHAVDSSEIAFRTAGRIGMHDALPECGPVLLEPVLKLAIFAPSDAMSKVTSILSAKRGQILGFDARPGWPGWDQVDAYLPQAEAGDLIIELRSVTQGLAGFEAQFDHMAELSGRIADDVVNSRTAETA